MKTFDDLEFGRHPNAGRSVGMLFGGFGTQAKIFFNNGYGASVVTGGGAYGRFEIAILKGTEDKWELCYSTTITDDVIGCDSKDEITSIMELIQTL